MRDAVARVLERAAASRPSLAIGFLVESGRLRSGWATAFSLQRVPRICRGRDVESPTGPGSVLLSAAILHGTDYPNVKFSSDKLEQGLDGARGPLPSEGYRSSRIPLDVLNRKRLDSYLFS